MAIAWANERRKLADLKPAQYNPRRMTAKQRQDLINSIDRFELADPLVINADNTIIGGHMRYRILRERGVKEVDCRVPDRQLTEAEERELNLRLNKNLGEWDWDALANFDEGLLQIVGFDDLPVLGKEELSEKTEELRPYNKAHVLVSFDAGCFEQVKALLKKMEGIAGLEVEVGSN